MPSLRIIFHTVLCLTVLGAIAPLPATAQSLEPVYLGPGDVMNLRFQGRESLNGEYVIGVEGDLFFPGIGGIVASGRTVGDVSRDLDDLMRENFGIDARTFSLSVSEFRPIYVGGRVRQPGSYTFRPSLRVAHAIAMAGGTRGLNNEEPIVALETGREYARLRVSEDQLARALTQRNRLLKALGRSTDPEATPEKLGDLIGPQALTFRAELQSAIAGVQDQVDTIQRDVLKRRAATAQGEVDALQSQLDALTELLDITKNEFDLLVDPSERGIIPRSRILELQRLLATTNGEISATLARRFSAQSTQNAFDGDTLLIEENRHLQNLLELSLVDAEVSTLRRTISASRETLNDIGGLPSGDGESCGIEVWRTTASELVILPATLTFTIQPGDFVRLVEKTADGVCDRQSP